MKILLTSLSGQLGGLELRLADEMRLLNNLGYRSTLALNQFQGLDHWFEELRAEELDAKVWNVPPFLEEWKYRHINHLKARLFHSYWLNKQKADLIHVAFAWTETGRSRLWLAHRNNLPTVISVHNTFPPWKPPSKWHAQLTREAFSSVKGIYGVSKSALDRFVSIYEEFFPKNIHLEVIHNFVDVNRFVPSQNFRHKQRAELNIPDNAPTIGTVGRLDKQKNPHYILDCFLEIRKTIPECYLVFAGQGKLESEIKKRVEDEELTRFVRFAGYQKHIENLIPAFDLHMLLSLREGFGIATAEAMSCGIPVIGTNVPGTFDILDNSKAGVLVSLDDAKSVSDSAVSILNSPDKHKMMSKAARLEATERFSREIWADKIAQFYCGVFVKI